MGKYSGCNTVGVARWSIHMDIDSYSEKKNIENNDKLIKYKLNKSRDILLQEDPTYLINTLYQLKYCIDPLYLRN